MAVVLVMAIDRPQEWTWRAGERERERERERGKLQVPVSSVSLQVHESSEWREHLLYIHFDEASDSSTDVLEDEEEEEEAK